MLTDKRRHRWTGSLAWDGNSMSENDRWIVQLTDNDINEISTAVRVSREIHEPIGNTANDTFPLEHFGDRLTSLKNELLDGCGFSLLSGLPATWTDEDLIRAYRGISSWIGDPTSQHPNTQQPGHIIDRNSADSSRKRVHQTHRAQPFHSNPCDITGQLCLRVARHGGASAVASSVAIHNELLDNDPIALEQLYGSFDCDRYGDIPEGKEPTFAAQIFSEINGRLICCGMDPAIHSAQQIEKVPRLTDKQTLSLDSFQRTAAKLSLNILLKRGDIKFTNNLITVHADKTFVDDIVADKRRYLMPLWLSSKHERRFPAF